jgi:hypothetical protein
VIVVWSAFTRVPSSTLISQVLDSPKAGRARAAQRCLLLVALCTVPTRGLHSAVGAYVAAPPNSNHAPRPRVQGLISHTSIHTTPHPHPSPPCSSHHTMPTYPTCFSPCSNRAHARSPLAHAVALPCPALPCPALPCPAFNARAPAPAPVHAPGYQRKRPNPEILPARCRQPRVHAHRHPVQIGPRRMDGWGCPVN